MMFVDEMYEKMLEANEKNLKTWEKHLSSLQLLNFDVYAEKLKVPALVPIGDKIFFRGEIKHTNEVTVSLGSDYFVKCSIKQAEVIKQHRIKEALSKIDMYRKEKEHIEAKMTFTKQNVFKDDGQEILEMYSEAEDKVWREKHRENVKKHKQETAKKETKKADDVTDEELWERLEELELQEELENELLDTNHQKTDVRKENTFLVNEKTLLLNSLKEEEKNTKQVAEDVIKSQKQDDIIDKVEIKYESANIGNITVTEKVPEEHSKRDLLQQVMDKHNELENKLDELHTDRKQSKTVEDLISKLDEMDQVDEIEDDMDRLANMLQTEGGETDEDSIGSEENTKLDATNLKKSISFADENDSETLVISFSHSNTEPNTDPFNPENGITKPSDVYEVYSHLFGGKTTSILKKSKYESKVVEETGKKTNQVMFKESDEAPEPEEISVDKTIVINDVVESVGFNQHNIDGGARPTSLFKKKRMQKKS